MREFLEFFKLDFSVAVFEPESGLTVSPIIRLITVMQISTFILVIYQIIVAGEEIHVLYIKILVVKLTLNECVIIIITMMAEIVTHG